MPTRVLSQVCMTFPASVSGSPHTEAATCIAVVLPLLVGPAHSTPNRGAPVIIGDRTDAKAT